MTTAVRRIVFHLFHFVMFGANTAESLDCLGMTLMMVILVQARTVLPMDAFEQRRAHVLSLLHDNSGASLVIPLTFAPLGFAMF
jgi:hypothetical protein